MTNLWRSLALLAVLLSPAAGGAGEGEPPPPFPPATEIDHSLAWTGLEEFTIDTLWEKINGEAELYRLYGLRDVSYARYEIPGDLDSTLEIGLYRLPSPLAAFGLFSSFRSPDASSLDAGSGASVDQYQGFLWHGRAFVVAEVFGSDDFRRRVLPSALGTMATRLGAPPARPDLLIVMEGVSDRDSVRYRPDHLLGRESLPAGLEGRSGEATLLLAAVGQGGEDVLQRFALSLTGSRREAWDGAEVLLGEDQYLGHVALAARGGRLAGGLSPAGVEALRPVLLRLLDAPLSPPVDNAPALR